MEQLHLVVPLDTFLYDTALSPNTEYRHHARAHNIKLMGKWVHSAQARSKQIMSGEAWKLWRTPLALKDDW